MALFVGALERFSENRGVVHSVALIWILLLCHSELLGIISHCAVTSAHGGSILHLLSLLISSSIRVGSEERRRLVPALLTLAENQLVVVLVHLSDVVAKEVTVADSRGVGGSRSHHVRATWH